MRKFLAKCLLNIINWLLTILFTEEEIEILEADYWKNRKYADTKNTNCDSCPFKNTVGCHCGRAPWRKG